MSLKNDKYTYRVTWSEPDTEYVGLCIEFPSLSWLAGSPESALKGIRQLVKNICQDMQSTAEVPPEPLSCKTYSGKFMVRIPPESHRDLAMEAAEAGVSLNRLASARLTR